MKENRKFDVVCESAEVSFAYKFCALAFFALMIVFALFAALPCERAWATVEGDQTLLTDEEIAAAIAAGELPIDAAAQSDSIQSDSADVSDTASALSDVDIASASDKPVKSIAGDTRYATSADEAKVGWPQGASTAILASGEGSSWADALSASSLAGALDCPVLLTPQNALDSNTRDALSTLGVSRVIIVGGTSAVSSAVEQSVRSLSGSSIAVERLAGEDRYETQLKIYEYGKNYWTRDLVIVARGWGESGFADALSASPVAFSRKAPIFLTNESGEFSTSQESALLSGANKGMFKSALIMGGIACVSAQTQGYMDAIACSASASPSYAPDTDAGNACVRIAGADRYATSAEFAKWAISKGYLKANGAAFASGDVAWDALGGGVLQGKNGSVLLLVSEGNTTTATGALDASSIKTMSFLGGKGVILSADRINIAYALGFALGDIEGLKVYLDAGHGYNSSNNGVYDSGALGCGYQEADLTAELARAVGSELQNTYGISVHVNDYGGWYKLRQAEAESLGCDVLISIHFNAGGGSGCESYIHSLRPAAFSSTLQRMVHPALSRATGLADRGMKSAQLAVVGGNVSAVLLEVAFIDNQSDMNAYQANKSSVASEIARGIAGR